MDCRELECLIYIITIVSYLNYRGIRAHQMYHNDEVKVKLSILQQKNNRKSTNTEKVQDYILQRISNLNISSTTSPDSKSQFVATYRKQSLPNHIATNNNIFKYFNNQRQRIKNILNHFLPILFLTLQPRFL